MSRVLYQRTPAFQITSAFGRKWGPSLAVWGAGAGIMALYVRGPRKMAYSIQELTELCFLTGALRNSPG
ncbi:hypothetical protein EIP86_000486 [Pleurotus ostreatoroseus]|nr:hypothetical protein EIP86_000486 [Pleurotus ostreatoroseus]